MSFIRQIFPADLKGSCRHGRKGEHLSRDRHMILVREFCLMFSMSFRLQKLCQRHKISILYSLLNVNERCDHYVVMTFPH